MVEQLSLLIDETCETQILYAEPFDISESYIQDLPGRQRFVDVLALIPSNIRDADELPRSVSPDERFDSFVEYVTAIWRYKRSQDVSFLWEEAEEICKAARESRDSIQLRIYLNEEFRPDQVLCYLK